MNLHILIYWSWILADDMLRLMLLVALAAAALPPPPAPPAPRNPCVGVDECLAGYAHIPQQYDDPEIGKSKWWDYVTRCMDIYEQETEIEIPECCKPPAPLITPRPRPPPARNPCERVEECLDAWRKLPHQDKPGEGKWWNQAQACMHAYEKATKIKIPEDCKPPNSEYYTTLPTPPPR